jgi:alpha-ribazole phosphatase
MTAVTRWWWIRHAPVVAHGGRIYGQTDVPCDTSDAAVFRTLARGLPADAVWVTSHLRRTADTAAAIAAAAVATIGRPAPTPLVEPDFAEQSFGRWHGVSWDALKAADEAEMQAFWRDPASNRPPGGESFAEVVERVGTAVARLTAAQAGRDIVAVAHGGTIRAALALALGAAPGQALAFKIDNLSLTRIEHVADGILAGRGGAWRVVWVNRPMR